MIKKRIKKTIKSIFNVIGFDIHKKRKVGFSKIEKIIEFDYGHLKSRISANSIGSTGEELPWFTYPSIEYLKQLDLSQKLVLEWGAGNSSKFFSKRVKHIYSIEHNSDWFQTVKKHDISNQTLFLLESDYDIKPLDLDINFDVIIIDGIKREECSKVALQVLNKGGLLILDNSDRYPDIAKMFRDAGLIEVDFHGLGPINEYTWTTSIFFERSFNFRPISFQPQIPIGGGF